MNVQPLFVGRVNAGRIEWEPSEAGKRRQHLESLDGKVIEAVIRQRKKKRSHDQNAWLWGVALPLLADSLGYDKHEHESLHYQLLAECFGSAYDQRFGREVPRVTSSRLSTKEFSDYMEWLVRWAAVEHNCLIPLPDEGKA
jgi:hypothetical protein